MAQNIRVAIYYAAGVSSQAIVFLIISGWWFVSNGREEGWAPCSYLEGDKDEEVITNLGETPRS